MIRFTTLLALTLLLGACGSPGPSDGTSGRRGAEPANKGKGNSLWRSIDHQLLAQRERRARGETRTVDLQAGAADLPSGWKEKIDYCWRYWLAAHRDWPKARAEWIGLGDGAERILVENQIRYYVLAWDAGSEKDIRRTEKDLRLNWELAATYLVEALSNSYGDDVARNIVGELLARLGPVVVPRIEKAWDGAGARSRCSLARVLKKMKSASTVSMLIRIAESREPWETRIEAIQGLGDLEVQRAAPTLIRCLGDQDSSVRKFAVRSLARLGVKTSDVLHALTNVMERALRESEVETARRCRDALRRLTGERYGTDPRAWRHYINTRGSARG